MEPRDFSTIDLTRTPELGDALIDQLSEAREFDPVIWSEASKCWLVLRHADIDDALHGKLPLSAIRFAPEMVEPIVGGPWRDHIPQLGHYVRHWVTNVDGPSHARMRHLASKAFTRPVVEGIRPYVHGRVAELLDRAEQRGGEVEFVEDVARELPGRVILKLMGLSDDLYPRLRHWANSITSALGAGIPTKQNLQLAEDVIVDMNHVFNEVLAERRAHPGGESDFISLLLNATDQGQRLSEDEMLGLLQLAVFAGHDTTANSMTLGVVGLSRNPDQWAYLRAHPEGIPNAVLELMRLTAMSAAQNRTALEDFEWHGKSIRKGDAVFMIFAAGNRDPRVFANPEKLDVTRDCEPSLVFGPGLHHCIGHLLAKMQLEEFFAALTARFTGADVLDPALKFHPPILFRGLQHLHIKFHAVKHGDCVA